MVKEFCWACLLMILLALPALAGDRVSVALQPFGQLDDAVVAEVKEQILKLYNVDVVVWPAIDLPQSAYYQPRHRYRAEKLALYLAQLDSKTTKIIGLTDQDISTTKGEIEDWGIFGMALLGQRPGIISTYRLRGRGTGKAAQQLFYTRLAKVVQHELGHTFGLDHCATSGCLMEDARGTIRVVDHMNGFCPTCAARLGRLIIGR